MAKRSAKSQANSNADPAEKSKARAAALLESIGGTASLVVAVFRRVPGGQRVHVATYDESEFTPEQVLADHGAGHYVAQVKEDNRIIRSKNFSVGDIEDLAPTPAAKPAADTGELKAKDLVTLMCTMMQTQATQSTAVLTAVLGRPSDGLKVSDIVALTQDRNGLGDTMKALEMAKALVGEGGDAPAPSGGGDTAAMITAIAQALPKAIETVVGSLNRRKHVENTAPAPAKPAANAPQNTTPTRDGAESESEPPAPTASGNGTAQPESAQAESTPGADTPPAGPIVVPPPSAKQPFPGARAMVEVLNDSWGFILASLGVEKIDDEVADRLTDDQLTIPAQALLDCIDHAGADPHYVFDSWDAYAGEGISDALIEYTDSDILRDALALLHRIDVKARELSKWTPPEGREDGEGGAA